MTGKIQPQSRSIHTYYRYQSISDISEGGKFRGPFRVIIFCVATILLPSLLLVAPLYLRYYNFQDVTYHVGESDLITVDRPISTFWCEGQDLLMNATFHAYLLDEQPKISEDLQHLELDKHMQLADDSLEYWGFFLLQGSKVILSVCSRYEGARLMVVKGTKNLKQCALLENPRKNPNELDPWDDNISGKGDIKFSFHGGEEQKHSVNFKIRKRKKGAHLHKNKAAAGISNNSTQNISSTMTPISANGKVHSIIPKPSSSTTSTTTTSTTTTSTTTRPYRSKFKSGRKRVQFSMMRDNQIVEVSTKGNENYNSAVGGNKNRKRSITTNEEEFYDEEEDGEETDIENEEEEEEEIEDAEDLEEEEEEDLNDKENLVENELEDDDEKFPSPVPADPDIIEEDIEAIEDIEIDEEDIRSSGSSFAKNLWSCYGGDTLFTQSFSPSLRCQSQDAMMKHAIRMRTVHEITQTGYYYYIFYSDNDILLNDIFARFEIQKIQYTFPNYTSSCLNVTQCSMPLNFLSSEKILLEVPLQDGVSDEDALAQMILVSTCRPRLAVYFIFPVSILFFIMCCAFM